VLCIMKMEPLVKMAGMNMAYKHGELNCLIRTCAVATKRYKECKKQHASGGVFYVMNNVYIIYELHQRHVTQFLTNKINEYCFI